MISAEGGMGEVPYDNMPALLHAKEMVIPAVYASKLRNMTADPTSQAKALVAAMSQPGPQVPTQMRSLASPAGSASESIAASMRAGSSGGGSTGLGGADRDIHFHFAPTVAAVDATGVDRMLQNHQDVFIKNVRNWHRNGKLGPQGVGR
ncbi:MAG TPA: hypothetical protein VGV37_27460, partial [Aliidongia sp.]|uniref:hypothetical protein n=1 Tax=Aliidongia sp. TaxID=1914230 RepID=UPI002DDD8793